MNKSASIKQHYTSNPIPKLQQTSLDLLFVNLKFQVRSWAEGRFLLTLPGPPVTQHPDLFSFSPKAWWSVTGPVGGSYSRLFVWTHWQNNGKNCLSLRPSSLCLFIPSPPCKSWWNLPPIRLSSIPFFSWSFQMELLSSHHLLFRD